jgi:hypothetical protein
VHWALTPGDIAQSKDLLNSAAFKNSRLKRAIWVMDTSLGHALSHIR